MKKFILLYHCSMEDQMAVSKQSQEEREKGMALWFAWKDELGDKLVDFGTPLFNGVRLVPNVEDSSSNLELSGYSVIQADDLEDAKKLVRKHPHFTYGDSCKIEIHEMMDMGM